MITKDNQRRLASVKATNYHIYPCVDDVKVYQINFNVWWTRLCHPIVVGILIH